MLAKKHLYALSQSPVDLGLLRREGQTGEADCPKGDELDPGPPADLLAQGTLEPRRQKLFLPVVLGALEDSEFSFDLEVHAKFRQRGHSFLRERGPDQNERGHPAYVRVSISLRIFMISSAF